MSSKHLKRVISEFENILMELSNQPEASFEVAKQKAIEYINNFCGKKNVPNDERRFLLESCLELTQDWFPDVRGFSVFLSA